MRSGALPTATGGRYASAARAFISPTACEQAREALWEREAIGSGLQGGAACLLTRSSRPRSSAMEELSVPASGSAAVGRSAADSVVSRSSACGCVGGLG